MGAMRSFLTIFSLLLIGVPAIAKEITIHGFVTHVKSPTQFAIDDYAVTRENSLMLDLRALEGAHQLNFRPEDIRVGTELEVSGEYDEPSRELKAKSISVFLDEARMVQRTALLEEIPALKKNGSGWDGGIRVDGEMLRVLPTASVSIKANKTQREKLPRGAARKPAPLESTDVLDLDTFVRYEGTRGRMARSMLPSSSSSMPNWGPARQNSGKRSSRM
jgi:hypothetical protein